MATRNIEINGLSIAELEAELASELPEREEMSGMTRFLHQHHHDHCFDRRYDSYCYDSCWYEDQFPIVIRPLDA